SPHADRALAHGLELAKLFSAELELFSSAYIPPSALAAVSLGMAPSLIGDARRETEQRIETLAGTPRARGLRRAGRPPPDGARAQRRSARTWSPWEPAATPGSRTCFWAASRSGSRRSRTRRC